MSPLPPWNHGWWVMLDTLMPSPGTRQTELWPWGMLASKAFSSGSSSGGGWSVIPLGCSRVLWGDLGCWAGKAVRLHTPGNCTFPQLPRGGSWGSRAPDPISPMWGQPAPGSSLSPAPGPSPLPRPPPAPASPPSLPAEGSQTHRSSHTQEESFPTPQDGQPTLLLPPLLRNKQGQLWKPPGSAPEPNRPRWPQAPGVDGRFAPVVTWPRAGASCTVQPGTLPGPVVSCPGRVPHSLLSPAHRPHP